MSGNSCRGTAALELAIVAPVLLTMLGGLADFGMAFRLKSELAAGVDAGAAYAFATEQQMLGTSQTLSSSTIASAVSAAPGLSGATVTVSQMPGSYCVTTSGTSATLKAVSSGSTCADGSAPGTYVTISASLPFQPLMPFYSMLGAMTLTASVSVRLS